MDHLLLLLIPLAYLAAAVAPARPAAPDRLWSRSLATAAAGPLLALLAIVALVRDGSGVLRGQLPGFLAVRLDVPTVAMLGLVTFIAAIILRYSRRYLDGQPGQARYQRWFLATIGWVTLLVVTNHLAILALAWLGSSLALHQLLTFHHDRPHAQIAAHKKFLLSRTADLFLGVALVLVYRAAGTLEIDRVVTAVTSGGTAPTTLAVGGVLIAAAVILRSAQLPFHGWLIQVMEAPTPVSALLHAGVVNIGGFVLIRLSGLLAQLGAAQLLLVTAGTLTVVLAGLVLTTRVSIKVALAWSTCAHMGFMLLECGLGAPGLALVHLLAHSLYKAHAFLSSGRTVERQVVRSLLPRTERREVRPWLVTTGLASVAAAAMWWLGMRPSLDSGTGLLTLLFLLGLVPLLAARFGTTGIPAARLTGLVATLVAAGAMLHWLAGWAIAPTGASTAALVVAASGLGALAVLSTWIAVQPRGPLARRLYPAVFAGFYLDELFTRMTFALWPPSAIPTPIAASSPAVAAPLERAA